MELHERIVAYIENHHPISYSKIVQVAQGKGFSESEVLQALDKIGNKVKQTVKRGDVWYDLVPVLTPKVFTHVEWWRNNYPPMNSTNDGSGIDVDFSWLFLRTPEERDAYRAAAKGVPMHMVQSRYGSRS